MPKESEITRIESMTSIQLLNQLYKEVIGMKVQMAGLSEMVNNLKDKSKDFGSETSGIHETCQKRYEKCNEKFEKQIKENGIMKADLKYMVGKYSLLASIASGAIVGAIVKFL